MKVLVIIPCYNESENICRVVQRLKATCPDVDYLVVNDCSTDDSARILRENGYNYLDLPLNLGIGGGVQSGYLYATAHDYDITVQMDGDGQHDPAYLQAVVAPVLAGHLDMCIGSRFITKEGFQTSFMRRVGIRFLSSLLHVLTGCKVLDVTSGYRACGKRMTALFAQHYAQDYPEPEAIVTAAVSDMGAYTWTYEKENGEKETIATDTAHILQRDNMTEISLENGTEMELLFSLAPQKTEVLRWSMEEWEKARQEKDTAEIPDGETVQVTENQAGNPVISCDAGYVYQVKGYWENGEAEYGFYTKEMGQ